jgi:hypothetical protein
MRLTTKAGLLFLAVGAAVLAAVSAVGASMPFNPTLDVTLSDSAPSANSNVTTVTSVASGNHALGTWILQTPVGWKVASGKRVPVGDVVASGTMSVDLDCDGSIEQFGPFELTNRAPGHAMVADWQGQITSFWSLRVAVVKSVDRTFEMSAFLTDITGAHTLCAPQTFSLTILGRSSPGNAVVLTNPRNAGNYTWTGVFGDVDGQHTVTVTDVVCMGTCP